MPGNHDACQLTQMSITVGGHYFENSVIDGQKGDVKSTTAQIEDQDVLFALFLIHTVSNGSGGGFVDDSHDIKTRNSASILGCLTLSIVEILKIDDNLKILHEISMILVDLTAGTVTTA